MDTVWQSQYVYRYCMEIIDIGIFFLHTWLAGYTAYKSRQTFIKFYVKRRETNKFSILENNSVWQHFLYLCPNFQQTEEDQTLFFFRGNQILFSLLGGNADKNEIYVLALSYTMAPEIYKAA